MKPKEFDELIRQKFDQNDFEYSPRNWDRLAEELDGRAKKRNVMMWWWLPLTGIAASVALAMGVPGLLRNTDPAKSVAKTETVRERNYASVQSAQAIQDAAPLAMAYNAPVSQKHTHQAKHKQPVAVIEHKKVVVATEIAMNDGAHDADNNTIQTRTVNLLTIGNIPSKTKEVKKPIAVVHEGFNTFKPEVINEQKKAPKLSLILSGGLNRGNQNNGYAAGATIRRMLNDKVFVEGDVAFSSSTNTQLVPYQVQSGGTSGGTGFAKNGAAAKTASPDASKSTTSTVPDVVIGEKNVAYNLSYAQVTPVIGYKIMKKMSLAAGPDFQQALADNRPVAAKEYRGTAQEAAMFDVGLVGKTEYAITRNIKAGVSYRKGINSVIVPTGKYIDRDYMQFQVKCAIFNK
ncbi:MAG: hypothetical protein JWQ38_722 [Flavipsychrobacter sp.]|nr:hypothetical protein [Flavipsychrobacter sp.]